MTPYDDDHLRRTAGGHVQALMAYPFARVTPMTSAEWAAIEERSRITMGSEEGARRSFLAAEQGRRVQHFGSWQE